jgi:c-di-GMP-binding flagellar brake protein YcgR
MKNKKKYEEKRRHPRSKKSIDFKIETDGSTITAKSIDLSCIGAYCQVDKYIPPMTNLKIVLALPCGDQESGAEHVECIGAVVRVEKTPSNTNGDDKYNIAIYFNEIEESEKEKIANFLEKHSGDS